MSHTLLQTLELGPVEVVGQDGLVVGVSALLDDDAGALAGGQAADVSQTLLGDDDVEVVLGLVDVGAEGDDAGDTGGVGLGGPGGGGVHDAVLGVAEEVGGAAEAVEHARAQHAGGVGVGVHVNLDGGIHADAAQAADDLGGVGDGLAAEEQLAGVALPVVVEALEAVGGEADGGGGGEVEVAAVEEVEEGVLQDFGPDLEVVEVGAALGETADDGVGDVADAGLDGEEVLGQAALVDLVLEELDEVGGDGLRALVFGRVGRRLVRVVGLDDRDDLLGVDGDVGGSDAVLGRHDQVGLGQRGRLVGGDVVQAFEGRAGGVDFNDDLVGHLDQLGRGANGGAGNDAAVFRDGRGFDDSHVELVVGLVQSVPALYKLVSHNKLDREVEHT